jgi:transposase InsO family protein
MREHGLNARRRRKYIPTTRSNHGLEVCENILNRQFYAGKPGEKWVSSYQRYAITYLRTSGGWVYLTVVLDLYDRKVLGWALSDGMESEHTVIPALTMAVGNRAASPGLIFHSDRGVQYCSKAFRELLRLRCPRVRQSMSRKGNCSGLRLRREFFQNPQGGIGNA